MSTDYSRKLSTHTPGTSIGHQRNLQIRAKVIANRKNSKQEKDRKIEQHTTKAEERKRKVMQMSKEETVTEAKTFNFTPPDSNMVRAYSSSSQPRKDLEALHDRWTKIHVDDMAKPKSQQGIHPGLSDKYAALSKALGRKMPNHPNLGISMNTEETNTEKREEIKNVARMDDVDPTSKESTLGKTGSIKKIIEEKPTMSLPNFGLSASLIAAARQIVEKKDDAKLTGGKTQVEVEPETNPDDNEDTSTSKKEKKTTDLKTEKEKKLAALAPPEDKITLKDVLVGRGVLNKKEVDDVNNDGDSDSYLKNRRKAIDKAIKEDRYSAGTAYWTKHPDGPRSVNVSPSKTSGSATIHYIETDKPGTKSKEVPTSELRHPDNMSKPFVMKENEQLDERENSPHERELNKALDAEFGYGIPSYDNTPKTSFGRAADRSSAAYALRALRKNPNTDTETGSDAVHQGWAKTATTNTDQTPEKKARRAALAATPYSKLPPNEQKKDTVAFNAVKKIFNKENFTADELARIDEIAQSIFEIAEPGLDQNGKQKGMGMNDVTNAVLSDEKKPKKNKM